MLFLISKIIKIPKISKFQIRIQNAEISELANFYIALWYKFQFLF